MEVIPQEESEEGGGRGDAEEAIKLPSVAERISQMETQLDKQPVSSLTVSNAQ